MLKRAFCLFFCALLLLLCFPRLPVGADDDFLLCVVENTFIEDVSDSASATYIGGTIYVPYRAIDPLYGIKAYYNERLQQLLIYTLDMRMTFDIANGQTYDSNGDFFPPAAVRRAGTIFIPIQFVCDRFDLYFSYTDISWSIPAPIIRICTSKPEISDSLLYARNSAVIKNIYQARQNPDSSEPHTDTPQNKPEQVPRLTYLAFEGALNEITPSILDTLENNRYSAAFFLPAENPEAQPDLLRRVYASGYPVGFLLTEVPEDPSAYLAEANRKLCAVLHTKTRLVCIRDGADSLTEAQRDSIIAAGFRIWDANINPAPDTSTAYSIYSACKRQLPRTKRVTVVKLSSSKAVDDTLPKLCAWLKNNRYSVLTMNEWDTPVNKKNDIR